MKVIVTHCFIVTFALCASAQDLALYRAREHGALARECLRVVDQDGLPVSDAKVWGGLQTGGNLRDFTPISGVTDTNGEYVIQGKCTNRIRCDITKAGYYRSEFLLTNYGYSHKIKAGKWQPHGDKHTIVLKKRVDNGKLAVPDKRKHISWGIPLYDKWLGFDLEKFDWCKPHGIGNHEDVLLYFTRSKKSNSVFRFTMDVSFTNNLFAGAYVMKKDLSSDLKTLSLANTNETFQSEFRYVRERNEDGKRTMIWLNENEYLVFRTRTTVEDGKLNYAHYGCIQGQWSPDLDSMNLEDGCFNPTPNNASIEDGFYLRNNVRDYAEHEKNMGQLKGQNQ